MKLALSYVLFGLMCLGLVLPWPRWFNWAARQFFATAGEL